MHIYSENVLLGSKSLMPTGGCQREWQTEQPSVKVHAAGVPCTKWTVKAMQYIMDKCFYCQNNFIIPVYKLGTAVLVSPI